MAKENEIVKTEESAVVQSNNLFGATPGENFLAKTLGQNYKQVKEAQIQYKVEDIEREMSRQIADQIIDLKRKARTIQDDLVKVIPTTPLQQLNLAEIDEKKFCDGMSKWRISCHNDAQHILAMIDIFQNMFGKNWPDDEKSFVKSMIIDFRNI